MNVVWNKVVRYPILAVIILGVIVVGVWMYIYLNFKQSTNNITEPITTPNSVTQETSEETEQATEEQSWVLTQKIDNDRLFEREDVKKALSIGADINLSIGADINLLSVGILKDDHCFWGQAPNPAPIEDSTPYGHTYIGDCYTSYDGAVYYEAELIEGSDEKTFEVLQQHYARDKNHVYHQEEVIEVVDPATFTIIDYNYQKDKNFVYYRDDDIHVAFPFPFDVLKIVERANPSTFEVFEGYARDDNHVYWGDLLIEGADVDTFEKVGQRNYKDKNYAYDRGTGKPWENVDSATFEEVQGSGGYYTKDKNSVYFLTKSIDDADPVIFEILGEDNIHMGVYARDSRYVYYGIKKIESADPASFVVMPDDNYAKDKNNVYYRGRVVEQADITTFETLETAESGYIWISGADAKDKNFVYNDGRVVPGVDPATCTLENLEGCK